MSDTLKYYYENIDWERKKKHQKTKKNNNKKHETLP